MTRQSPPKIRHHGWLNFDKPQGISSNRALSKIKRLLRPTKVGFAGTLDPLASGCLPLAFGEATKVISHVTDARKTYHAALCWGIETATDDAFGAILHHGGPVPADSAITRIIPGFIGDIDQKPPIYSALKHDGRRAYELARAGHLVATPPRRVSVYAIRLLRPTRQGITWLEIECGKGTYIRSLARDSGRALGSFGHIIALRRVAVGHFRENKMISLASLEKLVQCRYSEREAKQLATDFLCPLDFPLREISVIDVDASEADGLRQGRSIYVGNRNLSRQFDGLDISDRIRASEQDDADRPNTYLVRHCGAPVAIGRLCGGFLKAKPVFNCHDELHSVAERG